MQGKHQLNIWPIGSSASSTPALVRSRLWVIFRNYTLTLRFDSACPSTLGQPDVATNFIWENLFRQLFFLCEGECRAAMAIIIPLTTVVTPPAICSSSWTYETEFFNGVPGGLLLQNALLRFLNCAGKAPDTIDIFSPGACSNSYTTVIESFSSGTTLAVYCPDYTGYCNSTPFDKWLRRDSDFIYTSILSQKDQFNTTSVVWAGCLSTYYPDQGTTTVAARSSIDNSGLNSTTVAGPILMWGQPISVGFQQKDLALFITTKSTSTSSRLSTSTSTSAQPLNTITQPYSGPTATNTTKPPSPSPSTV